MVNLCTSVFGNRPQLEGGGSTQHQRDQTDGAVCDNHDSADQGLGGSH